jgi:hypothetical protein
MADIDLRQPVGEGKQLAGGRAERADLPGRLRTRARCQPAGDDRAFVDIEPGAAGMDDLHDDLQTGRPGGRSSGQRVPRVLLEDRGQQTVIPASAQVEVRIGLVAPTHRDLCSAGASVPIFIRDDGARAMEKSGQVPIPK